MLPLRGSQRATHVPPAAFGTDTEANVERELVLVRTVLASVCGRRAHEQRWRTAPRARGVPVGNVSELMMRICGETPLRSEAVSTSDWPAVNDAASTRVGSVPRSRLASEECTRVQRGLVDGSAERVGQLPRAV